LELIAGSAGGGAGRREAPRRNRLTTTCVAFSVAVSGAAFSLVAPGDSGTVACATVDRGVGAVERRARSKLDDRRRDNVSGASGGFGWRLAPCRAVLDDAGGATADRGSTAAVLAQRLPTYRSLGSLDAGESA
jgi:hypothetical protein